MFIHRKRTWFYLISESFAVDDGIDDDCHLDGCQTDGTGEDTEPAVGKRTEDQNCCPDGEVDHEMSHGSAGVPHADGGITVVFGDFEGQDRNRTAQQPAGETLPSDENGQAADDYKYRKDTPCLFCHRSVLSA